MTKDESEDLQPTMGHPSEKDNKGDESTVGKGSLTSLFNEQTMSFDVGDDENPSVSVPGYEIEKVLGRGGMGVVYRARHIALKRLVALKMILASGHASSQQLARFQIEVEAAARLQHPNIVQIHEVGEAEGFPYCALELVSGEDLSSKLRQQPLAPMDAAELVATLARAMQFAHSRNVVHRDLKPANIMLTTDGTPKIADFGLARRIDSDSGQTVDGAVMGTPSYMAPEQASGLANEAGPVADVYALGAILYDCLVGDPPFKGTTVVETLEMVRTVDPVPPSNRNPNVPLDLDTVCMKCLRKDQESRYSSAAELAEELERFIQGKPILARPISRVERGAMWVRRNPVLSAVLAVLVVVMISSFALINWQLGVANEALRETERERRVRALSQVNNLCSAVPGAVPGILADLRRSEADVLPRLQELWGEDGDETRKMRLALALLPKQPDQILEPLFQWMLDVEEPAEVLLALDAMVPHKEELAEQVRTIVEDRNGPGTRRFRAMVALAVFDPDSPRLSHFGNDTVELFFEENPFYHGQWADALRPIAPALAAGFQQAFRDKGEHRNTAARILADYLSDQPESLATLVLDADPKQFNILRSTLEQHRKEICQRLRAELSDTTETTSIADGETAARRKAMAATVLLQLGESEPVWPIFKHSPHPELRSQLTWRVGLYDVDPMAFIQQLENETDVSARRALIIALGDFSEAKIPADKRTALTEKLLDWYRNDPDPGIHAAVDWLLRHNQEGPLTRPADWNRAAELQEIDNQFKGQEPNGKRNWYVNGQSQTMVILDGPSTFLMGSPDDEPLRFANEQLHTRKIDRKFAIGSKLITVDQYTRYSKDLSDAQFQLYNVEYSPTPDCPVNEVTWFTAAGYCNWLSKQEGIPESQWCYPKDEELKFGLKPYPDYLQRTGYRLATEAEWEYACRAKSVESHHYGSSLELLPRYAIFKDNGQDRTWTVGQKRPNDFGLFDMHGNAWTWIQDPGYYYWDPGTPKPDLIEDVENLKTVSTQSGRVLRGGSYDDRPLYVRSAYRWMLLAIEQKGQIGLRVARTIRP